MSDLVAGEALSSATVRVSAESRLADVMDAVEKRGATHAVVVDGDRVIGVISLNTARLSNAQRIFADLTASAGIPAVAEETPLSEVANAMTETRADAVQVFAADGEYAGIVTQTSMLHASLEAANRRFHEIQQLRSQHERLRILGQMVCGMAHDLNNLLTPVIAGLEMIQLKNKMPPESEKYASTALTAAEDMASVVKRLNDFYNRSDPKSGREAVDLSRIAAEVRELTRVKWRDEPLQADRHVQIVLDLDKVPPVEANPSAVREVLVNLVFNAVDAIEGEGQVMLKTRADSDRVAITVSDNGSGMTDAIRKWCFEPFFTTKGERGTGLGLSVSRDIVATQGGRIEVSSTLGKGSAFVVSFPRAPERSYVSPFRPVAQLEGLRVLFAEDTPSVRTSVSALLRQLGLEVDSVASVLDGKQLLKNRRYHLVVTDLSMPNESGLALARAVKEITPEIPVVVTTGWSAASFSEGLETLRCVDAVLEKPFNSVELNTVLSRLLG